MFYILTLETPIHLHYQQLLSWYLVTFGELMIWHALSFKTTISSSVKTSLD